MWTPATNTDEFRPWGAPRVWRERISPHFTVDEFAVSASHPRLVSSVPRSLMPNVLALAMWGLEPLRVEGGSRLRIISGYRSAALNAAAKGSITSQHMRAEAADIVPLDVSVHTLWQTLLEMIRADVLPGLGQCIYYPRRGFLHLAVRGDRWPFPHTCVHDPVAGANYAHVDPTWEATTARLRYTPGEIA